MSNIFVVPLRIRSVFITLILSTLKAQTFADMAKEKRFYFYYSINYSG